MSRKLTNIMDRDPDTPVLNLDAIQQKMALGAAVSIARDMAFRDLIAYIQMLEVRIESLEQR